MVTASTYFTFRNGLINSFLKCFVYSAKACYHLCSSTSFDILNTISSLVLFAHTNIFHLCRTMASIPLTADQSRNEKAFTIFEVLDLVNKYTNKFHLKDAQCIRPHIVKMSLKGYCTDPKKLPYLILHKIMSYDNICCRSNIMRPKTQEVGLNESESDLSEESDSYSSEESDEVFFNPNQSSSP